MIVVIAVAILLVATAAWATWRRWISPWRDARELVETVTEQEQPRTFLLPGNAEAHRLGLALENIFYRVRDLKRQLQEREASGDVILSAIPDGLLLIDDQLRVRLTNHAFSQILATQAPQQGQSLLEVVRDAEIERCARETIKGGKTGRADFNVTRGSEEVSVEVNILPLPGNSEHLRGAIILFRDVTELRHVDKVRRDFVANVSHELRTPLAIFRGYLETLLEDPKQPPGELVRILEVMEKHSNRLNLLIEDVLSLARLEHPKGGLVLGQIRLADFFRSVLRDWEKRFAAKKLRVVLHTPNELPALHADEHRLEEVVYNLIDNAVKYSPVEGSIEIEATTHSDMVQISVRDEGAGIPAEDLPRIFERFYRADKARGREAGGTGLGLSIVKHIVELHDGKVAAESVAGSGTTVRVELPLRGPTQGVTQT